MAGGINKTLVRVFKCSIKQPLLASHLYVEDYSYCWSRSRDTNKSIKHLGGGSSNKWYTNARPCHRFVGIVYSNTMSCF